MFGQTQPDENPEQRAANIVAYHQEVASSFFSPLAIVAYIAIYFLFFRHK